MITLFDNVTVNFSNMGEFVSSGEWIHPEITTPTHELIVVTKGVVYIEEDDKRYELLPGDVICLKPGIVHKGYKKSEGVKFFWLHFYCNDYDKIGVYYKKAPVAYNYSAFFRQLNHQASCSLDNELIECKLISFLMEVKNGEIGKNKLFFDMKDNDIYIHLLWVQHILGNFE